MGDFDAEQLAEKTALLVHSCIVPEQSENPVVTVAIQHCHGSLLSQAAEGSLVESCSVSRGDCNPVLADVLTDSVKGILGREPLLSSWVSKHNKQE